jgi:hypothetical protein
MTARSAGVRPPYLLAGAALAASVTTTLIVFGAGAEGRLRFLDTAAEWSWTHVAATAAFAAGTVAAASALRAGTPPRPAWRLTAGAFGVLLADNVTRAHTHIAFWPAVYAPLLAILAGSAWSIARGTEEAPVVGAGLGLLAASIGIHVLGPGVVETLGWSRGSWAYALKVGLKEGTELAGWTLVVPALWRCAGSPASRASRRRSP